MRIIALIVAGGSGTRMNTDIPKQYLKIGSSSVINTTIKKFLCEDKIDGIFCVIKKKNEKLFKLELEELKKKNLNILGYTFGGLTRQDSVLNGLEAIRKYNPDKVLIHDAVRPFVSSDTIKRVLEGLKKQDAVVPVVKIVDTIKKVNDKNIIEKTVSKNGLYGVQTPQGFQFDKILKLHQKYKGKESSLTDDASLFENEGLNVYTVDGNKANYKITLLEDYELAIKEYERMNKFNDIRVGQGFDAHRFSDENIGNKDNKIFLGGINIPHEKNIKAHSDGDVLIHSLVDAMLGAIGEGDIGYYFPPSDKKWKNANSRIFLEFANKKISEKNYKISNIDITVICEKPRISKYKEEIRNNLADILKINVERINIKGTTTEKMGFTGRGEGIAVQSVISVIKN
ncbi:bifunctional 2-C-methyl-D-erythritol 4-phosphate cytidylyltransferase/2-C-methyl-D-erythritol 2,4-cyclodiphosphate synthase [Pseudomonadota bacterium]